MSDSINGAVSQWKEHITSYVNARIDLLKLETADKVAHFWVNVVTKSVMLYFVLLALIFLSFSMAFFLGEILGSTSLGFLLTGLFYVLLTAVFYALRRAIVEKPVIRAVMRLFFNSLKK